MAFEFCEEYRRDRGASLIAGIELENALPSSLPGS